MLEAGHQVVLFDNLSNSKPDVLQRLKKITIKPIPFVEGDVRDSKLLEKTLKKFKVDAVIHFAGLKAVAESVKDPIEYYANNVQGSISLLRAMKKCSVKIIVFSSSATVYGEPQYLPYDEEHPTNPINPYGRTKLHVEQILKSLAVSDSEWRVAVLRYFNPVGAHDSGMIGEDPKGIPNNLMPILNKVASRELPYVEIFGDDYSTKDGTAERDYIHVVDLAEGHLAALNYLLKTNGCHCFNIGTGEPRSVFELLTAFKKNTHKEIPFKIAPRRDGDLPIYYSSANKASTQLNWRAIRSLEDMCSSSSRFYEYIATFS
jgi:UDP-glucose 4-epimerase